MPFGFSGKVLDRCWNYTFTAREVIKQNCWWRL